MLKRASVLVFSVFCHEVCAEQSVATVEDMKLSWGGRFNSEFGGNLQNDKYKKVNSGTSTGTTNNHDVQLGAAGSFYLAARNDANKDFTYGAHAGVLVTERSKDFIGKNLLDRTYLFMQGQNWGKVELGSNDSAASAMKIQGNAFNAGEGSWEDRYVSLNSYDPASNYSRQLVRSSNFLKGAKLILQGGEYASNHESSRKVTYYTPKINGVQLGVSYVPDSVNKGGVASLPVSNTPARSDQNGIAAGITFDKDLGNKRTFGIALIGESAKMAASSVDLANGRSAFHRAEVVVLGAKYTIGDWFFSMSYGNRGKSTFQKNITENTPNGPLIEPKSAYYYSVGSMYKWHPASELSLFYLHSNQNTNTFNLVTFAGNYLVAPGVKVYAEYSRFDGIQRRDYIEPKSTVPSTKMPDGTTIYKAVMLTGQKNKINGSALLTGITVYF